MEAKPVRARYADCKNDFRMTVAAICGGCLKAGAGRFWALFG